MVREARGRIMTAVTTYSRRHIDLQRVAAALCPAHESAASRRTAVSATAR